MRRTIVGTQSIAACLDRVQGSVFRSGTVSHLLKPSLVDPLHVVLGVGCHDWGVCMFLTVTDAAKLNAELGQLLAEHAASG